MFQNYLKIALRNLKRQKSYTAINIAGLATGMACCLLLMLYVQHEFSFDRFHTSADRIYRVNLSAKMGEMDILGGTTPPPLAQRLMQDFPEVERATRIFPLMTTMVRHGEKVFNESGVLATDENFFKIFSFRLLEGSSNLVLAEPRTAVLTRSAAEKYFGTESALGKTLLLGTERREFKVVGIVENPPSSSHFTFEILTSISTYNVVKYFDWSWVWAQLVTYVQLKEGASVEALQAKLPQMVEKYAPSAFERIGQSFTELKKQGGHWDFLLQPLLSIRLYSGEAGNRLGDVGSIQTVTIVSAVAVLIIVLACINFINLATARSARRAKEVGIRKSLGVSRENLIVQFLAESFLVSVIAMIVALCLVELVLPSFNDFSGKTLSLNFIENPALVLTTLGLTVLVGIIAGAYPAFYLSSVKPVAVLSGKLRLGVRSGAVRNGLVIFQFAVSIALIACTTIVYTQLNYVRTANMGFTKENVVILDNTAELGAQAESLRQSFLSHSSILSASLTTSVPGRGAFIDFYKPEQSALKDLTLSSYLSDEHLLPTLGIEMALGHNFTSTSPAECQEGILINEEAAKRLGWADPIGQYIIYPGGDNQPKYKVIGVMKNFNVQSLHAFIEPFAVFHSASKSYNIRGSNMLVRIRAGQTEAAMAALEQEWKRMAGGVPFEYSFMDTEFERHYRAEQRLGKVMGFFTAMTIGIACLGLFGLAAFMAESRTKEIGIRKVLGASVASIIGLLSKDFLKLVVAAIVIATPLAYWLAGKWLQDFAYKVELSWWMFAWAGAAAIVVALVTVAGQSWRSARANPVQSLRSE